MEKKISPVFKTEIILLGALSSISKNLTNETLNKSCIMEFITGNQCNEDCDHNCDKCLLSWYSKESN